jgi:starch phosphorylase
MDRIFRRRVAASWRARVDRPETWRKALEIPDRELWSARNELRQRLVRFVRDRVRRQLEREGVSSSLAQRQAESVLDPGAFTIGFARRFALYKRADLIFHDLQRARALFHRPRQPVQLVYAGKPHPEDAAGRALLERVVAFSMRPEFRGRVVVLENYDIDVGAVLVQGVDLWLNNPLRPQEASGTSGQKVPFNGGLNASILDGWWDEGFDPKVGWAFGKASDHESRREQDLDDAKGLHDVLAREIVPLFYERGRDGIPRRWLEKVRHSMAALIPSFSSRRMLSRYIDELYIPAARLGRRLRAGGEAIDSRAVRDIVDCRESIERSWPLIHVREVHSSRWRGRRSLSVDCFLAGLSPELARCEVRFLERRPAGAESWSAPLPCETVLPAANGGSATFIFLMPERKAPRARIRLAAQCPGLPANELGLCVEVEAEA